MFHPPQDWKSFWITGFTNAQGFLTAIRQEVNQSNCRTRVVQLGLAAIQTRAVSG